VVETKVFQYTDSIDKQIGGLLNYSNGDVTISNPLVAGLGSKLSSISYLSNSAEARVSLLSQLALQDSDGLIRILAEPRLILQSGKLASVSLNTDKYFITPGVNVSGDIKPLPTGVTFEVTPTVLGDRRIKLSLKIIQSEFINNTETGVAAVINKNTIETTVVANDGELISLGGILTRKDTQQSSGMLGLRNIPVIGYLFSSEAEGSLVSRVEFFIRPTINRSHEKNEESVREAHDANCKLQVRVGGETCDDSNQDAKLEEIK
jgi:protein transport protein HofQ